MIDTTTNIEVNKKDCNEIQDVRYQRERKLKDHRERGKIKELERHANEIETRAEEIQDLRRKVQELMLESDNEID